jgi:hypothetical protein
LVLFALQLLATLADLFYAAHVLPVSSVNLTHTREVLLHLHVLLINVLLLLVHHFLLGLLLLLLLTYLNVDKLLHVAGGLLLLHLVLIRIALERHVATVLFVALVQSVHARVLLLIEHLFLLLRRWYASLRSKHVVRWV